MKRSHDTLIRHSLLAALCAAAATSAALQIDLRSGLLLGFPAASQEAVQPAIDLGGTLYGDFALGKNMRLSIEDRLSSLTAQGEDETEEEDDPSINAVTGASKKLPASEQNVPTENVGGIDLSYKGLRLGYRNQLFGRTRSLDASYISDYFGFIDSSYTYTFQYKRKMRQRYEGQYRFENERFETDAALYHIITTGAIDTMLNFTDYYNTQPLTSTATRIDLEGGVRIPQARMRFLAGGRIVSDHSGPPEFNSMDLYVMVGGDAAYDLHRIDYRLRTDYFAQGYLEDTLSPAYAITGLFHTVYLRGNLSLSPGFMIKGLSVMTFTENLFKQRYEVSLRRAWFNGTSVEGGASTTMGGLFPMVGYFVRTTLRPIDQFSLSLRLKSVWDWPGELTTPNKTLFVKAIGGGEIAYRIGAATECYLGGDLTYYNSRTAKDFPTRLFAGGGLRFCLP